ncbi:MAG: thiamine-binding protein [Nitriliruptoraceae bacterium]
MMCAFSIAPLGAGESVGEFVADIVKIVRASGLEHETNAMFTNVSGPVTDVFGLLERCVAYADEHHVRVTITAKFDHRPGSEATLTSKRERVERLLD